MLLVPDGSLGFRTLRNHECRPEEERGCISRTEEDERLDTSGIVFFFITQQQTPVSSRRLSANNHLLCRYIFQRGRHLLIIMKLIFSIIFSDKSIFDDDNDIHMKLQVHEKH